MSYHRMGFFRGLASMAVRLFVKSLIWASTLSPVSYTHLSGITIEDNADDLFAEQADRIAAWNKALGK